MNFPKNVSSVITNLRCDETLTVSICCICSQLRHTACPFTNRTLSFLISRDIEDSWSLSGSLGWHIYVFIREMEISIVNMKRLRRLVCIELIRFYRLSRVKVQLWAATLYNSKSNDQHHKRYIVAVFCLCSHSEADLSGRLVRQEGIDFKCKLFDHNSLFNNI